ncbi:MAG: glutamate synthase [Gammaproteobacteria bacterium]|nr:glutamate synthase [Gammaproteobacteria bacterium]MAY02833.1 glutamate synthase [Gammaproteobacteria bacterium]|tara:strand:+ start:171 stop:407 length:237 start_codon:yes stop_codon:yes gene_type:complete
MTAPVRAADKPYATEVEEGRTYYWCACGRSSTQPFCDGSHKGTDFAPLPYKAEASRKVFFCGCKASGKQPMCDGSHSK